MHSVLNHGKSCVKLCLESIKSDKKKDLNVDILSKCGVSAFNNKNKLEKMDGDQIRLVIAALSMILMEKRYDYFVDQNRADLMFKIMWCYASINHALYVHDSGDDYSSVRCIILTFLLVSYSRKLVEMFPKVKTTKKVSTSSNTYQEKKKTYFTESYFDFTYFHDLVAHFMFFTRTCSKSDMSQENEERSWSPIKKWIRFIKEHHAFTYINSKEYCQNLNNSIQTSLKSIFPFYSDMGEDLEIPLEFVFDSNMNYKKYFLFTLWHLVDVDPKRFVFQNNSLRVQIPLVKGDHIFENDKKLEMFSPDMREDDFYNRMKQIFKLIPEEEKTKHFLYKSLSEKDVLFWRTEEENEPWYLSEETIKKIGKKKSLQTFLKVCKSKGLKDSDCKSKTLVDLRNQSIKCLDSNKDWFENKIFSSPEGYMDNFFGTQNENEDMDESEDDSSFDDEKFKDLLDYISEEKLEMDSNCEEEEIIEIFENITPPQKEKKKKEKLKRDDMLKSIDMTLYQYKNSGWNMDDLRKEYQKKIEKRNSNI